MNCKDCDCCTDCKSFKREYEGDNLPESKQVKQNFPIDVPDQKKYYYYFPVESTFPDF